MSIEEAMKKATAQGNSLGQIALSEFILKAYAQELSPRLTQFFETVLRAEYDSLGKDLDRPAEDIALEVGDILERN